MQELWFLRSAHRVMLIDDKIKCLEDILNKNEGTEWTQFCDGQSSKRKNSNSIIARVVVVALCTSSHVD